MTLVREPKKVDVPGFVADKQSFETKKLETVDFEHNETAYEVGLDASY